MLCAKSLAENDKQGMGGLQWFHEMKWADYPWEFCAEEYSDKLETWHSSGHCHNCHQQMQSSSQSESRPTFEDDLQQLDNALLPLKADLLNSCVAYANHIEAGIMIIGYPGRRPHCPDSVRPAGPGQARSESATVAVTDRGSQDAVLRCRRFRRRRPVQPPAAVSSGRPGLGPGADPVCHIVTNR
jgi:hypothetical protein